MNNLFFVGYSSEIYVYLPQFPTQAIPQKPALIVPSLPSRPGLRGYLDTTNPHSINNLVVQNLGNEEVVAAVRDDGDVDAFLVRHIVQAIERRAEPDNRTGAVAHEIKPFFQSNVGKSAWGLAIHSQARVLAVSANTHSITVFKFGLVVDAKDATSDGEEDDSSAASQQRHMDVTHRVYNGTSNIPYIAFCNTGDDPKGRWLLTTDISGFCRSIDMDTMQPSNTFRFGIGANHFTSHDRFNSGWAIMFLDRKSFVPEKSFHAALGLEEDETLPGVSIGPDLWDIGYHASHVPDCSEKFTLSRKRQNGESGSPQSLLSSSLSQSSPVVQNASSPSDAGGNATQPEDTDASSEADATSEGDMSDGEGDLVSYYEQVDDAEADFREEHASNEGIEDYLEYSAPYAGRSIHDHELRAFDAEAGLCGDLPCPILHASVRNVYLVQPSDQRGPDDPLPSPTVSFTSALYQLVQQEIAFLNVYERLNMNAYIPSIGVVVLASQKGRAMILSLTKLSGSARYPAPLQGRRDKKRTKYAMRVERIVPFASQEQQMQRPFAPLLGIAAGPLQGTEKNPNRWRLMLTYADHSILSYEISRRGARDSAVNLESVVV